MTAEGWYRDPFGLHTDRWFSAGTPTILVRDDGVESHDPPPDAEITGPLVPSDEGEEVGDDLRRADEPATPRPHYRWAAWAAIESQPIGPVKR